MVEKAELDGRGGLNPAWMESQFKDSDLRRATFDQGAVAWEYKCDGMEFGRHVRVVMRHGIVASQGHGAAIAQAMHSQAAFTDPSLDFIREFISRTGEPIVEGVQPPPSSERFTADTTCDTSSSSSALQCRLHHTFGREWLFGSNVPSTMQARH